MAGLGAEQQQHVAVALQRQSRPSARRRGSARCRRSPASAEWRCRSSRCRATRYRRRRGSRERGAGLRHAFDGFGELAHDLGPLGIAEIHAVGDGERVGADSGEIAPALGDRLLGAFARIRRRNSGASRRRRWRATFRVPCTRTTAASPPGRCTVSAMTMWSYCSQIQRREESAGEPISVCSAAKIAVRRRHVARVDGGRGWLRGPRTLVERAPDARARQAGCRPRPRRDGAPRAARYRWCSRSPRSRGPISGTRARRSSRRSGFSTMSMRSWLSDSIIS